MTTTGVMLTIGITPVPFETATVRGCSAHPRRSARPPRQGSLRLGAVAQVEQPAALQARTRYE